MKVNTEVGQRDEGGGGARAPKARGSTKGKGKGMRALELIQEQEQRSNLTIAPPRDPLEQLRRLPDPVVISLITKEDTRFEGIFYHDGQQGDDTIILSDVRVFGSKDRLGRPVVQASNEVYESIAFDLCTVKSVKRAG